MDITQIVVALIGLLSAVLTGAVIPYIRSKTGEQQQYMLKILARTAVYAAQQLYKNNEDKYIYAYKYITDTLENAGCKFDAATVQAAIESAVKQAKIENQVW